METAGNRRAVRSFVLRGGRLTDAQHRALAELWPRYGIDAAAALDLDAIFGRRARRVVEIGSGENLLALAAADPESDFLGMEVHPPGIGRLLRGAAAAGLKNIRVLARDAAEVFENALPDASCDEILIFFPDPWPKKRHHKRRLVQAPFVALAARKLRPHGVLRVATDWQHYAEQMLVALQSSPLLENLAPAGGYCERPASRPRTRFERRGLGLGHPVRDLAFRRTG